jgi:hypothetical protein
MVRIIRINVPLFTGRGYKKHDRRIGLKHALSPAKSAHLFRELMANCPNVQVLSVNMSSCIASFSYLAGQIKFPEMPEVQLRDSVDKGSIDGKVWGASLTTSPTWKKLNFKSLEASCVEPMVFYDCDGKADLRDPTLFLKV